MTQTQAGHSGALNFDELQNTAMNMVENVCGIVSRPVEMVFRPWHGTRYFSVPVIFLSTVLMILLPVFSAFTTSLTQMIPFTHFRRPVGLFGIGSLSELYFLLSVIHSVRLYRRMLNMELEENSTFEGPPLPFYQLIPGTQSFWRTRIVIEPVSIFLGAWLLGRFYIFQSGLTSYLEIAALMLCMKCFIAWFRQWEYLRQMMDARFAGPIISKLAENRATEQDLATVHLASFPKNLSPEMRDAAVSHIARSFNGTSEPHK